MTGLRLLADDLTGALDTAAQFVGRTGPISVYWHAPAGLLPANAAVDCATREASETAAAATVARWADTLRLGAAAIPYLKLDSLLRGHAGREIASCLASHRFGHCIIAPAFPFQQRATRAGRQWARFDGHWSPVGEDIAATLANRGHKVTLARPGDPVPAGISLWDAETTADLDKIAEAGHGLDVLWCGSGGLAASLAGTATPTDGAGAGPILGLFGTDHPTTAAQLDQAGAFTLNLPDGNAGSATRVRHHLADHGAALVRFALSSGLPRAAAAALIERQMADLVDHIDRPGRLVAGGGETVRALCRALGAHSLEVTGQIVPGVPRAVLNGGRWDGLELISKSGAFGDVDLLRRLAAEASLSTIV